MKRLKISLFSILLLPLALSTAEEPKGATLVTVTASSEEANKNNFAWKAVDGDKDTRWCAASDSNPQWIQLKFEKPQKIHQLSIDWESTNNAYQFNAEHSMDGKSWAPLVDGKTNQTKGRFEMDMAAVKTRFVKITVLGSSSGGWASIREIGLKAPGITSIYPKLNTSDPYETQGNVSPKIVKLTPEKEAEILADVEVPEGFDVSLFANSAAANYPVYVAAAPNGDLYVSSDGNGSLGRDPHRGRVLRLRDEDGDGRADQVTEFVKDVDSPRGLVWDRDRLYLLHPPHITVFHDKDGDGVSEKSERLIEGIAFGFEDRPADHTTNGLDMGIDGWLYVAGGDFGFMNAKGTDGTELQHRGGGVIRFRPDGSGLEIFSTGTRNILGTPISPLLDIFARDNTNDGGGWDVRFHHFTGLEDHGYPRLYKNFGDEHIQPLADYGGGSGCGSTYLSEPGFPAEWNNAPLTCDWGSGGLWKHTVEPKGATFIEPQAPELLIKLTRATDATVDGNSGLYQASWKGATFRWEGPDVGYIARVTPRGYQPKPLPNFKELSDSDLVAALESESQVRTLAAQRELIARGNGNADALFALAKDAGKPLDARVAALFTIVQTADLSSDFLSLAEDEAIQPFAIRALGDMNVPNELRQSVTDILGQGLKSKNPRSQNESIVAATRQGFTESAAGISTLLGNPDPILAHTAFQSLARLGAHDICFQILDSEKASSAQQLGATYALMRMHDAPVVDGLIARLKIEKRTEVRPLLISAITRLHSTEAEWTGDSWGTRPDTRGPYYQLTEWSESKKIMEVLQTTVETTNPSEAALIVKEMSRNRVQSAEMLNRVLALANDNPKIIPDAVTQLATADSIPPEGVDILLRVVRSDGSEFGFPTMAEAVTILAKIDSKEGFQTSITALGKLDKNIGAAEANMKEVQKIEDPIKKKSELKYAKTRVADAKKLLEDASTGFLKAPKLENHHDALEELAESQIDTTEGFWATAGVLELASRKNGSPESRELSQKAVDHAWQDTTHRIALIKAAAATKNRYLDERIQIAMTAPDPKVKAAAKAAAKTLKIQPKGADKTPKIATLELDKAIAAIIKQKGDIALGESVFARATCVACHTVSQDEPQKGPYLGNIAETYPRNELATNILDPNKTIAQGFATNMVVAKDGTTIVGFVTDEAGDTVTMRDIGAQEHTFKKADISQRQTLPTSMMPPGLMNGFSVKEAASLLDYLESLVKK